MSDVKESLDSIAETLVDINKKMGRFVAAIEATKKSNDEWMDGRVTIDALTHTALLNAVCKLSDHFDKWFELQNNPRVFVSKQPEQEEFEDQELYWSNEDGWVSLNMADLFSNEEKERYNLPVGGSWLHTIDGWVVEQTKPLAVVKTPAEQCLDEISEAFTAAVDVQDARKMGEEIQELMRYIPSDNSPGDYSDRVLYGPGGLTDILKKYGYGPKEKG